MSTNLGNLTTGVIDSYYHCFLGEQRFQGYIDTLGLSSGDPDSGYWATNYIKGGHQIASHRREMESVDTKTEGKTNDASAGWDSGKESKVIITNWWYQKKDQLYDRHRQQVNTEDEESTFRRDKLLNANEADYDIIREGNASVHEGIALMDLYIFSPKGRHTDHATFTALYGLNINQVERVATCDDIIRAIN